MTLKEWIEGDGRIELADGFKKKYWELTPEKKEMAEKINDYIGNFNACERLKYEIEKRLKQKKEYEIKMKSLAKKYPWILKFVDKKMKKRPYSFSEYKKIEQEEREDGIYDD